MKKIIAITSVIFLLLPILNSCKKDLKTADTPSVKQEAYYSQILAKLRNIRAAEKNNKSRPGDGSGTNSQAKTTSFDYSNPDNPYEWVGVKHNECLEYVSSFMSDITDDDHGLELTIRQPLSDESTSSTLFGSTDKMIGLTQKFWNEQVMDVYVRPYVESSFDNEEELNMIEQNLGYLQENKLVDPRTNGSDEFIADFWSKLQYFQETERINEFETHADSIIINQLLAIEDIEESVGLIIEAESIINGASIEDAVKTRQLVFLSILRNSIGYWETVMADEHHPWWTLNADFFNREPEGQPGGRQLRWNWKKFWRSLVIGIADAVGGVVGTVIAPPILGAAVGGVLGAGLSATVDVIWNDES